MKSNKLEKNRSRKLQVKNKAREREINEMIQDQPRFKIEHEER